MQMLFPLSSVWLSFVFLRPCGVCSLNGRVRNGDAESTTMDVLLCYILEHHVCSTRIALVYADSGRAHTTRCLLTDEVVKPEQGSGELPLAFHDHPDAGADTPINKFCIAY